MTEETVTAAADAAQRFSDIAEQLLASGHTYITGNALTGELRRASMDLTRRLAEMRRPMRLAERSSSSLWPLVLA
jgi:hypothetical protein